MELKTGTNATRANAGWALAALALLALATGFRLWNSLAEPLWLDEAYSAYAADKGFGFLWRVVPSYETHPPFYYSLLRAWTLLFGDHLAGLRSLGYLCGLATLPVIWLAARGLARDTGLPDRRVAWTATAFAGVSISLVAMTREVRPYPVMILVYAATIWALFRLGAGVARSGRVPAGPFAGYLVGAALMLWLHNLGLLYALALGLAMLALVLRPGLGRCDWALLIGGHVAVALAWSPALLILIDQAPTWVTSTWLRFSFDGLGDRLAVLYGAPGFSPIVATIVLAGLAAWRLVDSPAGRRYALALAALALVPALASIALSVLVAPVFIIRTLTPVAVPAMLVLAIGTIAQPDGLRRWLGLGSGLIVGFHMVLVDIAERQGGPQQDWYAVVRFLAPRWRPGDVLLAYPNEGALPLDYALRDKGLAIPVRPVPVAVPALGAGGWHPTGSRGVVSLPPGQLRAIVQEPAVASARTVWLLRLGPDAYDKGDMFLRELARGRREVARIKGDPIDLIALRRTGATSARPAAPAGAAAAR